MTSIPSNHIDNDASLMEQGTPLPNRKRKADDEDDEHGAPKAARMDERGSEAPHQENPTPIQEIGEAVWADGQMPFAAAAIGLNWLASSHLHASLVAGCQSVAYCLGAMTVFGLRRDVNGLKRDVKELQSDVKEIRQDMNKLDSKVTEVLEILRGQQPKEEPSSN